MKERPTCNTPMCELQAEWALIDPTGRRGGHSYFCGTCRYVVGDAAVDGEWLPLAEPPITLSKEDELSDYDRSVKKRAEMWRRHPLAIMIADDVLGYLARTAAQGARLRADELSFIIESNLKNYAVDETLFGVKKT